jgi:hypothetical protein
LEPEDEDKLNAMLSSFGFTNIDDMTKIIHNIHLNQKPMKINLNFTKKKLLGNLGVL